MYGTGTVSCANCQVSHCSMLSANGTRSTEITVYSVSVCACL